MTLQNNSPLDNFLPFLLRRLTTLLNSSMSKDLKRYGINVPRWRVIAVLHAREQCNIAELTQLTSLTQPGVSQVVDLLEAEKLVTRSHSPEDQRRLQISLTKKGLKLFDDIIPTIRKYQNRLTKNFEEKEKLLAIELCQKMLDNIQE